MNAIDVIQRRYRSLKASMLVVHSLVAHVSIFQWVLLAVLLAGSGMLIVTVPMPFMWVVVPLVVMMWGGVQVGRYIRFVVSRLSDNVGKSIHNVAFRLERLIRDHRDETMKLLDAYKGEVKSSVRLASDLEGRYGRLEVDLRQATEQFQHRTQDMQGVVSDVEKRLQAVDEKLESYSQRVVGLESLVHQLTETYESAQAHSSSLAGRIEALEDLRDEHASLRASMAKLSSGNSPNVQSFQRVLTAEDLRVLRNEWLSRLALDLSDSHLYYLAHETCVVEDHCRGRLATSIQSMIVRILVARAVGGRSISVLEIGTLFGISVAVLARTCRFVYDELRFVVIDPLEGYYDESISDVMSGVPVTRAVLEANVREYVNPDEITVVQASSHEPDTRHMLDDNSFDVIYVDGDHTEEGIRQDVEDYISLLRHGGYMVIDDYEVDAHPGVTAYVRGELLNRADLRLVGSGFRNAVFQKVGG